MKPTTKEWVEKAENDFRSAAREMRARKSPNPDLACFCAQQCAEKYLKALLHEQARDVPRTHDLAVLLDRLAVDYPELELLRPILEDLSTFAVAFRCPGASASKELAKRAYRQATVVRESSHRLLRLAERSGKRRRQ